MSLVGHQAPDFQATAVLGDGQFKDDFKLSDFRGKTVVVTDQAGFVATAALIRRGAASARKRGFQPVTEFGAPFSLPSSGVVAG